MFPCSFECFVCGRLHIFFLITCFITICDPWQVGLTAADKFGRDVIVDRLLDCLIEVLPHVVDV